MTKVKTPVVFIIFNRPDTTEMVFREIAKAQPSKLLVVADGPRGDRPGEAEKCSEARKIIERVNWDCEVLTCFSDTNLGCKERVSSGLTWAFEQVEEAIILEDDCLPDPSFFPYCDELLEKYRMDASVMAIGGACFLGPEFSSQESYYFSNIPLVWGWASWRRAWKKYDIKMGGWPEFRDSQRFRDTFPTFSSRTHFRRQMDRTFQEGIDTWDYQWTFSIWKAQGHCVNSTKNLIKNVGFGPDATHTQLYDPVFDPPLSGVTFPLAHPRPDAGVNINYDRIWLKKFHHPAGKVKRRFKAWMDRFF